MNVNYPVQRYQRGATLIVALVILLVMSLVGLASMSSSTLQSRMAFNKKQKMLSLLAAESILKAGEKYIADEIVGSSTLSRFNGSDGLFAAAKQRDIPLPIKFADLNFSNSDYFYSGNWSNANSVEVTSLDSSVSVKKGRYFIEFMGSEQKDQFKVTDPAVQKPEQAAYLFRVVAIAWGQDPNIYSVLQSTFKTGSNLEY